MGDLISIYIEIKYLAQYKSFLENKIKKFRRQSTQMAKMNVGHMEQLVALSKTITTNQSYELLENQFIINSGGLIAKQIILMTAYNNQTWRNLIDEYYKLRNEITKYNSMLVRMFRHQKLEST